MIDERAIISPKAKIGKDVHIGPFSIIGDDVELGDGCWVGPHVVINGPTKIGVECQFFQFSSIGEVTQDKKYRGEHTQLVIGDRTVFREGTTVHRGTEQGGGVTSIGSDCLFMAYTHVAHDCHIGNHVIFSNGASVAGHVTVGDYASLGGLVGVHQFCAIGEHSFIAGGAIIYKDVPPYIKASGYPATPFGINTVGLERRGFTRETLKVLKDAYKIVYRNSKTVQDAIKELTALIVKTPEVGPLVEFLNNSERGIVR